MGRESRVERKLFAKESSVMARKSRYSVSGGVEGLVLVGGVDMRGRVEGSGQLGAKGLGEG